MLRFSLKNSFLKLVSLVFGPREYIDQKSKQRIIEFTETLLKHKVKNSAIFIEAFTHKSFADIKKTLPSNQRLEFLGDAVLDLVVADFLYKTYADKNEGFLTKSRSRIVNKNYLVEVAGVLELEKYLLINRAAYSSVNFSMENILADGLEAFIGAIYYDLGFDRAYEFIEENILTPALESNVHLIDNDYKSQLLEISNSLKFSSPIYRVIEEVEQEHVKSFTVEVVINGKAYGSGTGRSKKVAQQDAAKMTIEMLKVEGLIC